MSLEDRRKNRTTVETPLTSEKNLVTNWLTEKGKLGFTRLKSGSRIFVGCS